MRCLFVFARTKESDRAGIVSIRGSVRMADTRLEKRGARVAWAKVVPARSRLKRRTTGDSTRA